MSVRQRELDWYKKHGTYPERIKEDANGNKYVEGDFTWNAKHENRYKQEFCETEMSFSL